MDLFSNYVYIALPIITVALIIIIGRSFGEKINILKNDNVKILCCFSFLNFLIAYPLFNLIHAKLGAMTSIVLLCYLIDNMIEYTTQSITETKSANIIKIGDNFLKIVKNIGVLVLLIISIQKLLFLKNELHNIHYEYMRNDPYYGAQFRKEEQEKYQEIQKWILEENKKGIDCVIFSTRANMYMLPLKQNHQDFDLPNLGNWGKNGEERVMNKIINLRNTNLLIEEKKGDMAAQESDRILKYIKENFTYKGKIADFLIYESKK